VQFYLQQLLSRQFYLQRAADYLILSGKAMCSPFFCQIAEAFFSGLANGTSATTFNPMSAVKREEMANFITRTQDSALRRGSKRTAPATVSPAVDIDELERTTGHRVNGAA
jgi:hypothetical protein